MEKILELAQKLKALAERGVGGEKTNAIAALEALLEKYNISPDELEAPIRTSYRIYIPFKQHMIFGQVFRMIMGAKESMYNLRKSKNTYVQDLTALEYLEIMATHEFYWAAYERDLEIFESAFIQRNKLFAADGKSRNIDDLTEEEKEKARKMLAMASNLDKHELKKQIEA